MHELSITREILEIISHHAHGSKVLRVRLEIGTLTAISPDAVRFCFEACRPGTVAEEATLEIIRTPGKARCTECGVILTLDEPLGQCTCGNTRLEWLAGQELLVKEIEVA